ncbi:hypothetical protein Pla108_14130 [Botrimarina colliarenosi]|uniref:Uncharacterized protein n=1 Tax=Botrimarina colliarenosi TaxID=2528001 RepID=A0A5C6AN78_9BACT|nr:plasmid replication protein RepC [Botrimarina colliarenosi]TWU00462.1 hypothetical protein Pla108_14130 [Botrimarina colliarenosi]
MQTNYPTNENHLKNYGGGRVESDALRYSRSLADVFCGLEEGADRYGLLLLVKRAGKLAGFTPRMVALLDYYLAFTRDIDWEEGGRPVVYQSLARTALDLGVSERQVQKLEAALFAAGAIGWNDSGNHKRYGQRCSDTGRIVYAYGVDLTPLAYLRAELEKLVEAKRRHDDEWMGAKRSISALRRRVRGLLAEWSAREEAGSAELVHRFAARYEGIAVPIRTHLDLDRLHELLAEHETLCKDVLTAMGVGEAELPEAPGEASKAEETRKRSSKDEPPFAHYKYTTQSSIDSCSRGDAGFQESVVEPTQANRRPPGPGQDSSGIEHISLGMALGAASERLTAMLPPDPCWIDLIEATYRLRAELGISQSSWGEACGLLGRSGAALSVLVTDCAAQRERDPVRQPPAYFRELVRRAEQGGLHLHRTVFGLLKTDCS